MLERNLTKREALSLVMMLDAGLICYRHYMCWVDERIMLEDQSESWVLELATTKDTNAAIGYLDSYIYSEPFENFNSEACHDEFVAAKWLLYKGSMISWATFLLECGDYVDGNYVREGCEYFYEKLNNFEDSGSSKSLEDMQGKVVFQRFSDVIQKVDHKYNEFLPYLEKYLETYGA